MKLLSKVVWSEGMYLGPQHFQAQSHYFEDATHFVTANLWDDAYGVAACQVDADALRNGTVLVVHARGLFEDGLAFDMPECDALPAQRNIGDAFSPTANHLTVRLGITRDSADGRNVDLEPANGSRIRYSGYLQELLDESTGRDPKPVRLGRKNIRLVFDGESSEDLLTLPIARIVRDGSGHFAFDATFIPPCLKISASDRLLDLLSRLVQILEEKSAVVSQDQPSSEGKFRVGLSSQSVARFWFLHAINSGLTPLRHLLLSKHGHPEELFREMLRLGGALCTFGLDVDPSGLPAYDHNQLDGCFQQLDDHIRRHLEIVVPSQAITIPLREGERYFYVGKIKDERCFANARWVLGIHANMGEADLIAKTQQFVKVCSEKFVPELVKRALPGLRLTHVPVPPAAIAAKVEFQYFFIDRSGPCWEHLMQTKSAGVYVPGELPSPQLELVVLLQD